MRLILFVLALAWTNTTLALTLPTSVVCAKLVDVVDFLTNEYRESPIMMGTDARDGSRFIMLTNTKTGSWSFIQYQGEIGCLLASGGHLNLLESRKSEMH